MIKTSIAPDINERPYVRNLSALPPCKKGTAKKPILDCNEVKDIVDIGNLAEVDKTASTYDNRGVATASQPSSPLKILHNTLKDKAVKKNTHPQLVLNEVFDSLGPEAPSSLRVVYQSLECYAKRMPITPNRFTKQAHQNDTTAGSKILCISRPSHVIAKSVRMATNEYRLPPLHKILNHISSQATLACRGTPIAPSIIVLGECGPHIQDNDPVMSQYERFYLEHLDINQACEMMSCFVLKDIAKNVRVSALPLEIPIADSKRPGFLIEWQSWKMCFIHLPNELAKNKKSVNSYLNGLIGTAYDKYHIIAGDFNYSPKKIMDDSGNNLASCFPDKTDKQLLSFTDTQLSPTKGTNSANSKIFDGFLAVGKNMYAEPENYIGEDGKVEQESMPKIVPLGLIPRIVLDGTTLQGQTYTDHQGFAFDIIVPHKAKEEKVNDKINLYQRLTEEVSKIGIDC